MKSRAPGLFTGAGGVTSMNNLITNQDKSNYIDITPGQYYFQKNLK
jgi:hypothetical protein